uniref:TSA: Wollemia nobilis Ref_Wollemi_Transcript_6318_1019 transcribed RNA sequence n=1 Tax=Wollemia nobilis TaxID=56998 RepID=A0A0C9RP58_9CONI
MASAFRASRQLLMAAAKSQRAPASASAAAAAAASKKIPTKMPKAEPKPKAGTKPRGGGSGAGILKPVPVSPEMESFCGASEISRGSAVKKIWEYIKENNLQNPSNKKEIICDEKLKTLFDGRVTVGFLEISKLLGAHFIKTNDYNM